MARSADHGIGRQWLSPGLNLPTKSVGPTWDGGPPPPAYANYNIHPGIRIKPNRFEGIMCGVGGRLMEGDMWPTCIDESVNNVAARGDHNYAPGVVANAYHTLGPIKPTEYMTFTVRRTQYLQRPGGVSRELLSHVAGAGGREPGADRGHDDLQEGHAARRHEYSLAAVAEFSQGREQHSAVGHPPQQRQPAHLRSAAVRVRLDVGIPPSLGRSEAANIPSIPAAISPSCRPAKGSPPRCSTSEQGPCVAAPWGAVTFGLPVQGKTFKAGESLAWRYLVVMDNLDQPVHNLHRIERIREYYGLDGKHTSGLVVKRGKLLSHFGLVDLAPENGIVEFEVPAPDFPLQLPLGLRFIGFNPNWALGQLQISGYSMGNYTNGANVYRNLATTTATWPIWRSIRTTCR